MAYDFYTTDVFTDHQFGGNPLAVFPNAEGLTTDLMQSIGREFNLSETIFFFPPEDPKHTVKARIFTPYREMPFAGHPTVGGAFVLASQGLIPLDGALTEIVIEEEVGPVPVQIYANRSGDVTKAVLTAAKPPQIFEQTPTVEVIARVLSLTSADILQADLSPVLIQSGTKRLFVPLRNRQALAELTIDIAAWHREVKPDFPNISSIYPYCFDPERSDSDCRGRMFSIPGMAMYEDPATGSAVTGLAAYLARQNGALNGTLKWVMEQGFEMGRPSILEMEADLQNGVCQAIRVGGRAVLVSRGTFFLPEGTLFEG